VDLDQTWRLPVADANARASAGWLRSVLSGGATPTEQMSRHAALSTQNA